MTFSGNCARPVVVRAVRDRDRQPVRLVVRAHGVVGAGLRGVVRRARPVRRLLGERPRRCRAAGRRTPRTSRRGGSASTPGAPRRLEQRLRAEDVRAEEARRVDHREAVVRLGGEVDDDVDLLLREQPLGSSRSPMSPSTSRSASTSARVRAVAGVRQEVEDDDVVVRMPLEPVADEVRADEAGSAGDEEAHGGMTLARSGETRFTNNVLAPSSDHPDASSHALDRARLRPDRRRALRRRRRATTCRPSARRGASRPRPVAARSSSSAATGGGTASG